MSLRILTAIALLPAPLAPGYAQDVPKSPVAALAGDWKLGAIKEGSAAKGERTFELPLKPGAEISIRRHGTLKGFFWLPRSRQDWTKFYHVPAPPPIVENDSLFIKLKIDQ